MIVDSSIIKTVSISILICGADWLSYVIRFKDKLKPAANYEKKLSKLFYYYNSLSKSKFRDKKLFIKSLEVDTPFFSQLLDLVVKLIFTVSLALMSLVAAVNSSMLGVVSKDEDLKTKNYSEWVEQINHILLNMKNGTDTSVTFLLVAMLLFICASNHLLINSVKQNSINRHLLVIEEVERSRRTENQTQ